MIRQLRIIAFTLPCAVSLAIHFSPRSVADETARERVEEVGQDTKKAAKKGTRDVKGKACEMVNGKLECAMEKVKDKSKNVRDTVVDKTEDVTQ